MKRYWSPVMPSYSGGLHHCVGSLFCWSFLVDSICRYHIHHCTWLLFHPSYQICRKAIPCCCPGCDASRTPREGLCQGTVSLSRLPQAASIAIPAPELETDASFCHAAPTRVVPQSLLTTHFYRNKRSKPLHVMCGICSVSMSYIGVCEERGREEIKGVVLV